MASLLNNIAPAYNPTESYSFGAKTLNNDHLYQCIKPTTGTFDPDAWTEIYLSDLMKGGSNSFELPILLWSFDIVPYTSTYSKSTTTFMENYSIKTKPNSKEIASAVSSPISMKNINRIKFNASGSLVSGHIRHVGLIIDGTDISSATNISKVVVNDVSFNAGDNIYEIPADLKDKNCSIVFFHVSTNTTAGYTTTIKNIVLE